MSAQAPTTHRSGSSSRRFNPLRALQPKRRLHQILSEPHPPVVTTATVDRAGASAASASAPVPIPVSAAPAFDYCRFIELDHAPVDSGLLVSLRPTKSLQGRPHPAPRGSPPRGSPTRGLSHTPTTPRNRRTVPSGPKEPLGHPSHCSSSSGSCKGSDGSPTKGRQKLKSCTENHGIRPPPPEQYLTPLQQKEVCIRHLRSKLKETIDTLQNRDCEVDELRERLFRMQEDWVEEECHRVEAQLALKEARAEIMALKRAVEGVRARLGDPADIQDINSQNQRLESLLLNMDAAQGVVRDAEERAGFRTRVSGSAPASVSGGSPGAAAPRSVPGTRSGSCSCEGSPARTVPRSSTYTKLSEQVQSGHEFGSMSADGTQDSGFVCESGVPSRADLLLEAAYLSEETAALLSTYTQTFAPLPSPAQKAPASQPGTYSQTLPHSFPRRHLGYSPQHILPHSSTYEGLCQGERLPSFHCGMSSMSCLSHPCLSHHHLYLHPLREAGIQTESCPIPAAGGCSDLDTIAEARTFRSQACSPTSTWASDDGEELDSTASLTTATIMSAATEPVHGTLLAHALPRSATVWGSLEGPLCRDTQGTQGNWENHPEDHIEDHPEDRLKDHPQHTLKDHPEDHPEDRLKDHPQPTPKDHPEDHPEDRLKDHLEDKLKDHPEDRLKDHLEDRLKDHPEDRLKDHPEDHPEDRLRDHPEDRLKDHPEDKLKDHPEDRLKDHPEDRLKDHPEDRLKDHPEDRLKDHPEDRLKDHPEDRLKDHPEDRLKDHPEDRLKDHPEDRLKDHPEDRLKDHPEDRLKDHPEDRLKDHPEGRLKDHPEDRLKDHPEDRLKDHPEGRLKDHPEDTLKDHPEDHPEGRRGNWVEDVDLTTCTELEDLSCPALSPDEPQISQPRRSSSSEQIQNANEGGAGAEGGVVGEAGGGAGDGAEDPGSVQKSYWSRHFLVDLLAVAIPVVPTVAWFCRGPVREGQPMYHIGSLLRGCCTVALHSLRRSGGLRHYPAGGGAHL